MPHFGRIAMVMQLQAIEDEPSSVAGLSLAGPQDRPATRLQSDELAGIVAAVCAKFPDAPRDVVAMVVAESFRHLKMSATVTTHLIPLTLNRSTRLMHESTGTAPIRTG
ncbi:hypothetical protein [Mycolicibacterium sp.]|uniref:hypothetical protein n=1 Tax=Mycolicibacterium sp. TaxID=2320850 RepID=UPI001A23BDBB|nr:hypothetical protein [Mycolicibacterium sp.]MBJ7338109.1 hypothetical protein [Mycolicibacterium sp.]